METPRSFLVALLAGLAVALFARHGLDYSHTAALLLGAVGGASAGIVTELELQEGQTDE